MIKGILLPDHVQVNKYRLIVPGLPPLTFLTVGALEEELDNTDLPDRTNRSGGRTKPVEFDVTMPMHHTLERLAMESWFAENKDPITPTAQKVGTLIWYSQTRLITPSYSLLQLYPYKRGTPEGDLDNDGEVAALTWGMKTSEVLPLT